MCGDSVLEINSYYILDNELNRLLFKYLTSPDDFLIQQFPYHHPTAIRNAVWKSFFDHQ